MSTVAPVAEMASTTRVSGFKATLQHARYILGENLVTAFAFGLLVLIVFAAVFGPSIVPYDPLASNTAQALKPPSAAHWFGTDQLGRDILSRVIVATRLDFFIAAASVVLVFFMGGIAGIAAGYFGGWTDWLGLAGVGDATVAFAGVLALFIVTDKQGSPLLTWQDAVAIPWGILLLFAGGIALAQGFVSSGLSDIIGQALVGLGGLPLWLLILALTLAVSFLTEVTSNTATATLLMPVLAATATALELPPEVLMIPAAIACSCAFCLPVATPPNSIVFASNQVTIKNMVREGLMLNIILAVLTTALVLVLV